MVRSQHAAVDLGRAQSLFQAGGDAKVVNPPTHIPLAGTCPVRPPGVGPGRVRVEMTEAVNESGCEHTAKALAFFIRKASIMAVAARIGQIDFLVSHIEVTAKDDGLAMFQILDIGEKVHVPFTGAVVESAGTPMRVVILCVGGVNIDQKVVLELSCENAALRIVFCPSDACLDGDGLDPAQDCGSGIALLNRAVPVGIGVFGELKMPRQIGRDFRLLQADHICPALAEKLLKAFIQYGAQAIHIPGEQVSRTHASSFGGYLGVGN